MFIYKQQQSQDGQILNRVPGSPAHNALGASEGRSSPLGFLFSLPPTLLSRHLSAESIVHTRTSVGLVPGHTVCSLSSMLISTTCSQRGADSQAEISNGFTSSIALEALPRGPMSAAGSTPGSGPSALRGRTSTHRAFCRSACAHTPPSAETGKQRRKDQADRESQRCHKREITERKPQAKAGSFWNCTNRRIVSHDRNYDVRELPDIFR